jgi:hypothetical protein
VERDERIKVVCWDLTKKTLKTGSGGSDALVKAPVKAKKDRKTGVGISKGIAVRRFHLGLVEATFTGLRESCKLKLSY